MDGRPGRAGWGRAVGSSLETTDAARDYSRNGVSSTARGIARGIRRRVRREEGVGCRSRKRAAGQAGAAGRRSEPAGSRGLLRGLIPQQLRAIQNDAAERVARYDIVPGREAIGQLLRPLLTVGELSLIISLVTLGLFLVGLLLVGAFL